MFLRMHGLLDIYTPLWIILNVIIIFNLLDIFLENNIANWLLIVPIKFIFIFIVAIKVYGRIPKKAKLIFVFLYKLIVLLGI